ncbi:uncharacterized protein SCHCODRAFT_02490298 [Schizophyllum commune H4-8]|nr:uncharacterized protein SCHCODRAFT_02490298 [Schizophyllum commune H4-8]KAI5897372.1 hypothetical protein SCHCODRAFT_02490298 [Schizophyllum commune H4-8]
MPPPTMGGASSKGKEVSRSSKSSGSKECSRSTGSSRRMEMDPPDVPMDMGEPVEIMCEPAWMSSQMPTMQTLFGKEVDAGRGSSKASKGKANALWNASPPSTQALASTSNAPAPITTRPPTSRNLSRSTSRSSVTSTSTATPHNDQPRPPPAALDDLVQRVNTNAASTMLAIDSRIIRHAQESGRPLTSMKARAIDIGFAVDKYGRPMGKRGKGKAVEKVAQGDAPMEVDLPPPVPCPQVAGRVNALARKDSRLNASSLPTPAPSRTTSLNNGVEGALPLPPPPAAHKSSSPAVFQHPPHAAPQPPPFAAPNPQNAALSHSPPSPQKGAEPQAKRRRVEPDENIGYQPSPTILAHTPAFTSQGSAFSSQTPLLSQRKQLGMRPARRTQLEKPASDKDKDRAHPRPFRPPLMASQTPNADANRVPPTAHPQGKAGKPASGGFSANGAPTASSKATPSSARKNSSPTKVPAAKCRSGRPPLTLEEVPDSEEEEDDKPLAKKRAPKRDSSPPVEADTSFDWDGAAAEMDAKGML